MLFFFSRLRDLFRRPLRLAGDHGATAVEYALMVAAIAVVIAGIVIVIGVQAGEIFTDVSTRWPREDGS